MARWLNPGVVQADTGLCGEICCRTDHGAQYVLQLLLLLLLLALPWCKVVRDLCAWAGV
jgi:hypothetical protein